MVRFVIQAQDKSVPVRLVTAFNGKHVRAEPTVVGTSTPAAEEERLTPALPIKRSVQPDFIVCLENGKRLKSLKRHLMSHFNMTPDEYRAKRGLPADYAMVATNYALARSELAKQLGLGRRSEAEAIQPSLRAARKPRDRKAAA